MLKKFPAKTTTVIDSAQILQPHKSQIGFQIGESITAVTDTLPSHSQRAFIAIKVDIIDLPIPAPVVQLVEILIGQILVEDSLDNTHASRRVIGVASVSLSALIGVGSKLGGTPAKAVPVRVLGAVGKERVAGAGHVLRTLLALTGKLRDKSKALISWPVGQ